MSEDLFKRRMKEGFFDLVYQDPVMSFIFALALLGMLVALVMSGVEAQTPISYREVQVGDYRCIEVTHHYPRRYTEVQCR